jgi:hypothetical protein
MKSYEVMQAFRKQAGAKMVAGALALSKSYTDKWCRPVGAGETGELNPLDRVVQMLNLPGGLELVKWLCRKAGGFFVRNPAVKVWRALTLLKATAVVIGQIAKFQTQLAQAEQDGRISPAAAEQLRADWEAAKAELESFVGACQRGAFRCAALFYPLLAWLTTGDLALAEVVAVV